MPPLISCLFLYMPGVKFSAQERHAMQWQCYTTAEIAATAIGLLSLVRKAARGDVAANSFRNMFSTQFLAYMFPVSRAAWGYKV
jgi:hypothetical protein